MDFKHIKEFSPRTRLSQPVYEQVAAKWNELGFEGEAPTMRIFEEVDH